MRKHNFFNIVILISLFLNVSCKKNSQSDREDNFTYEYYFGNGPLKLLTQMKDGKKNGVQIFFWIDGEIGKIQNYKNDTVDGEVLSFDGGKLEWKASFKNKNADGYLYDFYKSGSIKSYRYFRDNLPQKIGFDYYDSTNEIKMVSYFNEKGEFFDREVYDQHSNKVLKDSIDVFLKKYPIED